MNDNTKIKIDETIDEIIERVAYKANYVPSPCEGSIERSVVNPNAVRYLLEKLAEELFNVQQISAVLQCCGNCKKYKTENCKKRGSSMDAASIYVIYPDPNDYCDEWGFDNIWNRGK